MAQRIIGLDVGSWSIKAMVMESNIRKAGLVRFVEHHRPRDPRGRALDDGLPGAIAATLKGLEGDGKVAAVPGNHIMAREVELPFADDKRIGPILGFQLESVLPVELDEVVYDYHLLDTGAEGEARLWCAAVDTEWLTGWLEELKEGGADPRYLTVNAVAPVHVAEHLGNATAGQSVAFVDLGHRTTTVTVLRDGELFASRTISRGGHHLTLSLMRGLELEYAEAEDLKHSGVRFDGRSVPGVDEEVHGQRARLVAKALEPLLREVRVTLHSQEERLGQRVDSIVVYGGTARLPGVVELVSRVCSLPAKAPIPKGALWEALGPDAAADGFTAAGLALRHVADSGRHHINFRQGDLAFESDFKAIRDRATWLAVVAMLMLALFFGRKYFRMGVLAEQEQKLSESLDTFTESFFETTFDGGEDPLEKFELVAGEVGSPPEAQLENVYPAMTAFSVFYAVSEMLSVVNESAEVVKKDEDEDKKDGDEKKDGEEAAKAEAPPERKQVELTVVSTNQKGATVTGAGFDIVTIEKFAEQLRKHPCFVKVERQGDTRDVRYGRHQGWEEFTLKLEVKCEFRGGKSEDVADSEKADKAGEK